MNETSLNLGDVPEEALALRNAAPSTEARLRSLVESHYEFVWRSLRRLGVGNGDVDDAVQKVFLVFSGRLSGIRVGAERSFLFQTALRVAADHRRTHRRRREGFDANVQEPIDATPGADELVDLYRARKRLDEILDSMPMELRAVFMLFEVEQMTLSEIAELLGVPRGTVASRLRRAKAEFLEKVTAAPRSDQKQGLE